MRASGRTPLGGFPPTTGNPRRRRTLARRLPLAAIGARRRGSVDAIAADAGFTKGAFYAHFESKEMVFLALLDRHMEGEAAELDRLLNETRRRGGGMGAIERWLDQLNADADWALLSAELQRHARRSPAFAARYAGLLAAHRDRLGALLEALFALSGKRPPMRSSALADAFMALSHGLAAERTLPLAGRDPSGAIIRQLLAAMIEAAPARDGRGAGRRRR